MTIFLALLATPYAFMQDLFAFSLATIIIIWERRKLQAIDVILLMYPAFVILLNNLTRIDVGPFFILLGVMSARAMLQTPTEP